MTVSKRLICMATAVTVVGAAGFAYAQTTTPTTVDAPATMPQTPSQMPSQTPMQAAPMDSTAPLPRATDTTGLGNANATSGTTVPASNATGTPLPTNNGVMITERAARADRN